MISFANYKAGGLWTSFMRRRKEIANNLASTLISMSVYKPGYFMGFIPTNEFEKWTIIEVADFCSISDEMKTFVCRWIVCSFLRPEDPIDQAKNVQSCVPAGFKAEPHQGGEPLQNINEIKTAAPFAGMKSMAGKSICCGCAKIRA